MLKRLTDGTDVYFLTLSNRSVSSRTVSCTASHHFRLSSSCAAACASFLAMVSSTDSRSASYLSSGSGSSQAKPVKISLNLSLKLAPPRSHSLNVAPSSGSGKYTLLPGVSIESSSKASSFTYSLPFAILCVSPERLWVWQGVAWRIQRSWHTSLAR